MPVIDGCILASGLVSLAAVGIAAWQLHEARTSSTHAAQRQRNPFVGGPDAPTTIRGPLDTLPAPTPAPAPILAQTETPTSVVVFMSRHCGACKAMAATIAGMAAEGLPVPKIEYDWATIPGAPKPNYVPQTYSVVNATYTPGPTGALDRHAIQSLLAK